MPPTAPSDLQVTVTSTAELLVEWTDNATDENGYEVRWAGGGDPQYHSSGDLDPGTESYTISGVLPNRLHVVRVDVVDDTGTASVGGELPQEVPFAVGGAEATPRRVDPVPASGWYVEIVTGAGDVHRPTVLADGVEQNPRVDDRPELRLPVPQHDKWTAGAFEGATVRAWQDGTRQPVDRLEDVESRAGGQTEQTVLVCRGGHELVARTQQEWVIEEAHVAARQVIGETSYDANVDDPDATVEENVPLATTSSTTEFEDKLTTTTDDKPLTVAGGATTTQQAAWTTEGEDADQFSGNRTDPTNSDYTGGSSVTVNGDSASGGDDFAEWTFSLDHPIPADAFGVQVRDDDNGDADGAPNFQWSLQHDGGGTYLLDELNASPVGTSLTLGWSDVGNGFYSGGDGYTGPDLPTGTYTLRVDVTDSEGILDGFTYAVDVVCPYDTRYGPFTFDNQVHEPGGHLDGPETRPASVRAAFAEERAVRSVAVGAVDTEFDDVSNEQALRLSNDRGETFATASNTRSFEHDFDDLGPSLIFQVDIGRYGQRDTATPRTGFKSQSLQSYGLRADLDDTPLVLDLSVDTSRLDALQQLAERGNAIFEFRRSDAGGSVEWTQPGQRVSDRDPAIAQYRGSKRFGRIVERAIVYGGAVPVNGEAVTASVGSSVDLAESRLIEGSETVRDAATNQKYQRNEDYKMDYSAGRLLATGRGDIGDGSSLAVGYSWRPQNSYTAEGVSDPPAERELTRTISGLVSDRACGFAARSLVDELQTPGYEAEVVLPTDETGWSVIEAVNPPDVPTGGQALHVREVVNTPDQTVLTLGNRQSISDLVASIQQQVGDIRQRT